MHIHTHYTEENWQRLERNWNAWWAGELERPMVMIEGADQPGRFKFYLDELRKKARLTPHSMMDLVKQPLPSLFSHQVPAEQVIAGYGRMLSNRRWYGDAWPRFWPNFGPGVAAAFLGANLHADPNTVWFEQAPAVDLTTWQPTIHAANPTWLRVQELTRIACEQWNGQVQVGITDLGGNLDILASLRGTQQLLMDVLENPEDVLRAANGITRAWLHYFAALEQITHSNRRGCSSWGALWAPTSSYMLQSDFAYMVSPRMFERFVLPDLAACCDVLEYPFYHLDGKGQIPHLNHLLSLKKLRGIQWIPGDGAGEPEEWLPLLKRIRDGGKLCQVYVTAQGALRIVRELGGKGFALSIREPMTPHQASAFLGTIFRA